MSFGSDIVNEYLTKANIKLNAPISSYLLLSRNKPQQSPSSSLPSASNGSNISAEKVTVIDHKNIPNIVDTSKSIVSTVRTCSHLCSTIDPESFLKLLRFQTNTSQSLIITDQKYILLIVISNPTN